MFVLLKYLIVEINYILYVIQLNYLIKMCGIGAIKKHTVNIF